MKNRCLDKNCKHYHRYGGRFEQPMPEAWKRFDAFLDDMRPKPTPKHEIDRIDNDKPYSKENCRWGTRREQTRNRGGKRATRLYAYKGKTLCIKDWADLCGIKPQSMQKRLNVGWPLERAFKEAKL